MPQSIGAFYQCYKQPFALHEVLKSFRAVYPEAPVTLLCDNGMDFSVMAEAYQCKYIHCYDRIAQDNGLVFHSVAPVLEYIKRLITQVKEMDTDWVILLEDDVMVYAPVDTDKLAHTLNGINPGEILPIPLCDYLKLPNQCYGGCGGAILSVPFIKSLDLETVLQECTTFWNIAKKAASDMFITAIVLRFGGTIGQYEGFAETWYPNLQQLQAQNAVKVLHQYKDLYFTLPRFKKVVIWGYPLYSHTHSYIHYGWHKAFSFLGYETQWLPDAPTTQTFEDTLFITEGYADKHIPLHPSNIYIIHVLIEIEKYVQCGCKFADMRYHVNYLHDYNYQYNLQEKLSSLTKISPMTYFEARASNKELHPSHQRNHYTYPAFYTAWATDLLPHEFNYNIENYPLERKTIFVGSVSNGNQQEFQKFAQACQKHGITVETTNPWHNPLSFAENKQLIQACVICPDIRGSGDPARIARGEDGTCHKSNGYIPCRVFKNISYGKLGATNSKRVQEIFGDLVVYDEDEEQLVEKCLARATDYPYIKKQMQFVATHHTYLNRVKDLLTVVSYMGAEPGRTKK